MDAVERVERFLERYEANDSDKPLALDIHDLRTLLSLARSNGWQDIRMRVLAALGGLRDDMPPEDVAAVQRFLDRLGGSED